MSNTPATPAAVIPNTPATSAKPANKEGFFDWLFR